MESTKTLKNKVKGTVTAIKETVRIIITKEHYDALTTTPLNRVLNEAHVAGMKQSVILHGLLRDVIVMWNVILKQYVIIDGQHLSKALMELGANVECRIVTPTDLTQLMIDLNNTSKSWTLTNYIDSWAKSGKVDYLALQNIIATNKTIQDTVILMAYTLKDRKDATKLVKKGNFSFVNKTKGDELIGYISDCTKFVPNTRPFNQALINIMVKIDNYNHPKMIKSLSKYAKKTKFSTSEKEIYKQLLEIYYK